MPRRHFRFDGQINPGDTVELINGTFINIREIYPVHQEGKSMISGHLLERNSLLMGWLPARDNEVFSVWTFPSGGDPEAASPLLLEVIQSEVIRIWNLHLAPPRSSEHTSSPNEQLALEQAQDNIHGRGTLICSWKYVCVSEQAKRDEYTVTPTRQKNFTERSLIAYTPGSFEEPNNKRGKVSISANRSHHGLPQYTFGDGFAGAGGMSRAAVMAGLNVKWGFDHDLMAIEAYRRNFPNAHGIVISSKDFAAGGEEAEVKVDILHVSPPCQYFCRANVNGGRNNAANLAAFYDVEGIIRRTDPRVVTLEEVEGLLDRRHIEHFRNLVGFFTHLGYSVRWKVINCADFGVPQKGRFRLFMIGSRPGTDLPEFPVPTHSEEKTAGLRRWTSVAQAIARIPRRCSENTLPATNHIAGTCTPYPANKPFPYVVRARSNRLSIMCDPTASRIFTFREIARLQSFPDEHTFYGERDHKASQIGNAVPPPIGHAILEQVRESLTRTDLGW